MPALLAVQRRTRQLRALRSGAEAVGRLGEDRAQGRLDDVELVVARDQRRRELHDRVAAVVGAADQAGVVEPGREEAAEQLLALLAR